MMDDSELATEAAVDAMIDGLVDGRGLAALLDLLDEETREAAAATLFRLVRPLLKRAYEAGRAASLSAPHGTTSLLLSATCPEGCAVALCEGGRILREAEGEVPPFLAQDGAGGRLIELAIDLRTGRLVNWRPPGAGDLAALFDGV